MAGTVAWHIRRSVNEFRARAQASFPYPDDDVASLLAFALSENQALADRNRAVWTLGRLRDPAALPTLTSLYTGAACDHETSLCQHELGKAIHRCSAGAAAH